MDKNKIKSFAIWARRSLIKSVSEKAYSIGIYEDRILEATAVQGGFKLEEKEEIFTLSKKDRDALVTQVREKGFEQVMEEVAYTWFNRFMGLRYMEVNDYLPTGVRILSSEVKEKKEPDVLTKISEIIDELNLNANEIYDLLDTGNTLDREKAYRIILVKQCNELGKIIPQMFEKISDYTELLLPDNLLEEGSVIRKMVEDIEESDWLEEVEIIGWMYQYYISEKKDEVFIDLKKNIKVSKENIPAATQLFTPKWIVKYMVQNSLGRLWIEGHPNEEFKKEWEYYLEEVKQKSQVEEELNKIAQEYTKLQPEEIKIIDPSMGSGHILVYAFEILYQIYKVSGYPERDIPRLILKNNIYGSDIDDRALQLASFALIMKARHYNRRLFREIEREKLDLNLCSIQESNMISEEVIDYIIDNTRILKDDIQYLINVFKNAKNIGSILKLESINIKYIIDEINKLTEEYNFKFADLNHEIKINIMPLLKQYEILKTKYDCCITNPPYMGQKSMDSNLKKYAEKNFKGSKSDLFAMFIEHSLNLVKVNSYISMITMESWMFLSSYEELRNTIVKNASICNLIHMPYEGKGRTSLGISFGTVAFVIRNKMLMEYKADNYCIRYYEIDENGIPLKFPLINERSKETCINSYMKIKGKPIAYWVDEKVINVFNNAKALDDIASPRQGLATGNNDEFLRLWHEIDYNYIGFNCSSKEELWDNNYQYVPYNKGGKFRKWYGNAEYILRFNKKNYEKLSQQGNNLPSKQYYFKKALTWTDLSSGSFGARYSKGGFVFDVKGSSMFIESEKDLFIILGFLNSILVKEFLDILNPTMSFQVGDLKRLPIIELSSETRDEVYNLVKRNIEISKKDWDTDETSWDFKRNGIIINKCKKGLIESSVESLSEIYETLFNKLRLNEIELNSLYIKEYGLEGVLLPDVSEKYIKLKLINIQTEIKKLISYAVGCIFGRYSIDCEGLIYAGGEFSDKWNQIEGKVRKIEKDDEGSIISHSWIDSRFMPDRENIIPITEDEYFEDDIVTRFIEFVKIVYSDETLEENLDFIADSIGRKSSETSRQAIRRYFIKDFYKDHLKVYQKRPIYWMFESGKNDGFKCLVYMHRYNEQTVAKVRTDYLHTLQRKYEAEINRLQLVVDSEEYTAKDRTAAKKKIDRIYKQIEECREYDQVVAYLANEKISIDLDDGVKVNYDKFQDIKVINSKGKETKMNLLSKI